MIDLFMSGGRAQQDLFHYKPKLNELNGRQRRLMSQGEYLPASAGIVRLHKKSPTQ